MSEQTEVSGNPLLDLPLDQVDEKWREHAKALRQENAKNRLTAKEKADAAAAADAKAAEAAKRAETVLAEKADLEKKRAEMQAQLDELLKGNDEAQRKKQLQDAVEAAVQKQKEEAENARKADQEAINKRLINSEVRSQARELGIQDIDALKLLDTSKLVVEQDTGEVAGVKELLEEFKKAKPYLFKEPTVATSQTRKAPAPDDKNKQFDATKATKEELAADAKARGLKIKTH